MTHAICCELEKGTRDVQTDPIYNKTQLRKMPADDLLNLCQETFGIFVFSDDTKEEMIGYVLDHQAGRLSGSHYMKFSENWLKGKIS